MKRSRLPLSWLTTFLVGLTLGLAACEIEQTEEGELPDVDVSVDAEAGDLPDYDVDWANVDVGTTTKMVEVPKVVVVTEMEEVEVPYVDVDMPEGGEKMERTITVEAEVEEEASIEIQEVYAAGDRLIVLSQLDRTGQMLDGQTVRVSDRLVFNAPDLDVKHYVIGEQPEGDYNSQYTFIASRSEISDMLQGGRTIYSR